MAAALDDADRAVDGLEIAGSDRGPAHAEEEPLQPFGHELAQFIGALVQRGAALGQGLGDVFAGEFDQAAVAGGSSPLRYASIPYPCG